MNILYYKLKNQKMFFNNYRNEQTLRKRKHLFLPFTPITRFNLRYKYGLKQIYR